MKRLLIGASLLLAAGCAGREDVAASPGAATTAPAAVAVVTRSATTVTGQPLRAPAAPWEAVILRSELPPGGTLPMHRHPWPRYAYIESGRLRVRYEASGLVREFGAGEGIIEALDEWHEAVVIGPERVRLIVFDQVPPGQTNVVLR